MGGNGASVRANVLESGIKTDADDTDEIYPLQSAPENAGGGRL